jgi:threonine dehydrogenase-like Zn-dependent dehydrogenase
MSHATTFNGRDLFMNPIARNVLAVICGVVVGGVVNMGLVNIGPFVVPLPEGADVVFECVGSRETIAAALGATRKGGRAVLVGNAPASIDIDGLALQRGDRSLVGVLMYNRNDLFEAMEMLAAGLLEGLGEEDLVQPYSLDDVGAAFTAAKEGTVGAVRAVVRP